MRELRRTDHGGGGTTTRVAKRLIIVAYDSQWPMFFEREKTSVLKVLGDRLIALEHVGSTAVPGLGAKPIIDIMGGLPRLAEAEGCIAPLETLGYHFVPEAMRDLPDDRYFERWTEDFEQGTELAHLHLTQYGSSFWRAHLAFRDILRARPDLAAAYERLKRELAPRHTSGASYSQAKTAFIRSALVQAQNAQSAPRNA